MKKFFKFVIPGIIGLSLAVWFGGRWLLSFSTADYEGNISVPGISEAIEITFDAKGIPQVWAKTDADIYFALGWLHASERLFQMELVRRVAAGELAEIFGDVVYEFDLKQRKIGFARLAKRNIENLDPTTQNLLQKYCDGANAWINYKHILPPEFILLGISPREWRIEDCLAIGVYQSWYSHELMDNDTEYRHLNEQLGDKIFDVLKDYKPWSPPTVHNSFLQSLFGQGDFPLRMSSASNSWVVAPQKTTSGAAIHCSDPHLAINRVPGFWYIIGLHSENDGTNVLGVTAPGLPGVLMGHNGKIAYSFTVASVDVIDYYRFKRDPNNPLNISTENGFQPLDKIQEKVFIKGKDQPQQETIFLTPQGPVISEDSVSVIALRWAGFDMDVNRLLSSGIELQNASNFSQFRKTVTGFGATDVNWVYSDIEGNIGYQLGTMIPQRDYQNTFALLDGENPENHWKGYYPLKQTPHAYNPQEGWLASCNNQIVSDNWPYPLPGFYDPYRITRASALLSGKTIFSREQLQDMQLNLISGKALRWKNLMADGAAKLRNSALENEIRDWNGELTPANKTATLYMLWWQFLAKPLFEDELKEDWSGGRKVQEEVLTAKLTNIIDDTRTQTISETAVDISAAALSYVLDTFERANYGDISYLKIAHPLAQEKWLDYWLNLNRGPFPIGGDGGALNANYNYWNQKENQFHSRVGPSMRFVMDWSDVDSFTIISNLGQSGNPLSPHYDDFLPMMQTGQRWVVPFSREKVYERKSSLLTLNPSKDKR